MKLRPGSYFLIFLVLLGLVGIVQSLTFEYFQSLFLPLLMSSVVFVLASIELVKEIRGRTDAEGALEPKAESKIDTVIQWRRFWTAFSWMLGLAAGICLFGFLISIPVFVCAYFKIQKKGWFLSAGLAAVITAAIHFLFEVGLKSPLYRGLLIQYLF